MPNYLVLSYDHGENQALWDYVEAATEEKARAMVEGARVDHILAATAALSVEDLRAQASVLEGFDKGALPRTAKQLFRLMMGAELGQALAEEERPAVAAGRVGQE